jgi:hypothetical protein
MMTFLLAAAATAAQPALAADPDVRCMAAYLVVAGNAGEDPTISADDKSGIQSIVMYFFGKVDVKHPGANLEAAIRQVVQAPAYATQLKPDVERCSAEAQARGNYLQSFGGDEKQATPPKP